MFLQMRWPINNFQMHSLQESGMKLNVHVGLGVKEDISFRTYKPMVLRSPCSLEASILLILFNVGHFKKGWDILPM